MTPADVPTVLAVQEPGSVVGLAKVFPPDESSFPREAVAQRWLDEIESVDVDCFVVEQDRAVVGFAAVRAEEILHFGIEMELWGTGVAQAALDAVLDRMRAARHSRAWLRVFTDNERGRRFYERLGWEPTGERSNSTFAPNPELLHYEVRLSVGLRRGTVELRSYDPAWAKEFADERDRLGLALGDDVVGVEHVGSTSVPGLSAKPLIDILLGLRNLSGLDSPVVGVLQRLGYQAMADRVYPERVFMPKGPEDRRTHHLHLVVAGSEEWRAPLRFRDALRADAALRGEYDALKRILAEQHAADRATYSELKADFIQRVTRGRDQRSHE